MLYLLIFFLIIYTICFLYCRKKYKQTPWTVLKKNTLSSKRNEKVVFFSSYNQSYINKDFVKANASLIKAYCLKNEYEYKQFVHPDDFISPYWLRVYDFIRLSNSYPEGTIFVYIDADAIVKPENFNFRIQDVLNTIDFLTNKNWDMYISSDPYFSFTDYENTLNAGVIIARNSPWAKNFFNRWYSRYNSQEWSYNQDRKSWKCIKVKNKIKKVCSWARDGYEQGELNNLYSKNEFREKSKIIKLHWSFLSCYSIDQDSWFLHLMSSSEEYRYQVFRNYLKELKI